EGESRTMTEALRSLCLAGLHTNRQGAKMAQSSQPILSTPQDAAPELPVRRLTKWFIQRASFAWIVTIAGLILMYILLNTSSLFWIDPNIRYYLVIPLLWI